jgi:Ca2+-binding EF-hand superfamily protein
MEQSIRIFFVALIVTACIASWASPGQAQQRPSDDMLKQNYTMVLEQADANKDGKLSMKECTAIFKDKAKGEKDCRYWDADGDGTITQDEYVKQVRKIMK